MHKNGPFQPVWTVTCDELTCDDLTSALTSALTPALTSALTPALCAVRDKP